MTPFSRVVKVARIPRGCPARHFSAAVPDRFRYCPCCTTPLKSVERDGVERLICPRCDFVRWGNPVPVVAAIVEHEGKIVLARNALWPPGMFALITGFMEKTDDSPEKAVLREVQEELGLAGEVAGFVGHYRFHRMNQLIIAYHVRAAGPITLDAELAEYRRVPPPELRPWPGATGDALRDWMLARGLHPLPYDDEPLHCIVGYRPVAPRLAAGGRPLAVQFLALSLGRVQTVVVLGEEDPADRRAAEAVGLQYRVVAMGAAEAPGETLARLHTVLEGLREQRVYVCGHDGSAAVALAAASAAQAARAPVAELHAVLQASVTLDPRWIEFSRQQLSMYGTDL